MRNMLLISVLSAVALTGCFLEDDNSNPVYGSDSGLPVNCRAYVQAVIDDFRSRKYTADEAMIGLERNCGSHGHAWKNNR